MRNSRCNPSILHTVVCAVIVIAAILFGTDLPGGLRMPVYAEAADGDASGGGAEIIGRGDLLLGLKDKDLPLGFLNAVCVVRSGEAADEGVPYIPLDLISQKAPLKMSWDKKSDRIIITYNDIPVEVRLGSRITVVNRDMTLLSKPVLLLEGKPYIPVELVQKFFGWKVSWHKGVNILSLDEPGAAEPSDAVAKESGEAAVKEGQSPAGKGGTVSAENGKAGADLSKPVEEAKAEKLKTEQPKAEQPKAEEPQKKAANSVNLTNVREVKENGRQKIIIETDAYAEYSSSLLVSPDRLVIDLKDTTLRSAVRTIEVKDSVISRIRASQFDPKTARVVMDLVQSVNFEISREYDGKKHIIVIEMNSRLKNVSFDKGYAIPRVKIETDSVPDFTVSRLKEPDRIVVDLMRTSMGIDSQDIIVNHPYIKKIRMGQFMPGIVRVVLETKGSADFMNFVDPKDPYSLVISFGEDDNLLGGDGRILLPISGQSGINIGNMSIDEKGIKRESGAKISNCVDLIDIIDGENSTIITITTSENAQFETIFLPNPDRLVVDIYNSTIGAKEPAIPDSDGPVRKVRMGQYKPDVSRVVFDLAYYWDHKVIQSGNQKKISIEIARSPLYGKRITLDAGHGGHDPGAVGPVLGLHESVSNFNIVMIMKELLEAKGAEVILTRSDNTLVSLNDRVETAKKSHSDIFVSIHANSIEQSRGYVTGTETYFSGFDLDSRALARLVQRSLIARIGLADRGIKIGDKYYVLRASNIPAILVEVAFISNPVEERMLADQYFIREAAEGIVEGIVEYFRLKAAGEKAASGQEASAGPKPGGGE